MLPEKTSLQCGEKETHQKILVQRLRTIYPRAHPMWNRPNGKCQRAKIKTLKCTTSDGVRGDGRKIEEQLRNQCRNSINVYCVLMFFITKMVDRTSGIHRRRARRPAARGSGGGSPPPWPRCGPPTTFVLRLRNSINLTVYALTSFWQTLEDSSSAVSKQTVCKKILL